MKKISIAYFGTPYFSAQFLEKLITDTSINRSVKVKLVVTQKDKPVRRKQVMTKSPVKVIAEKFQIPTLQINQQKSEDIRKNQKPENSDKSEQSGLSDISGIRSLPTSLISAYLSEIDLALVFAYGQQIPKEVLILPKHGFFNIHWSLLPKYRGAAPLPYALLLGDKETGISIFLMDEKIDTGPIIAQEKIKLDRKDMRPAVDQKFLDLSYQMFVKLVNSLIRNPLIKNQLIQQNNSKATYTYQFKKEDGFVPLVVLKKALNNKPLTYEELPKIIKEYYKKNNQLPIIDYQSISNFKLKISNSPEIISNLFRGLYPWPGLWTLLPNGKRLKITDLSLHPTTYHLQPIKVQLEGKKEVDFNTFNSAYKIF